MPNDQTEYVLATFEPRPILYGFYNGQAAAEAALAAAGATYTAMPLEDYTARERAHYLSGPLALIERAAFDEACDMLPPIAHQLRGSFEAFISPEPTAGTFHQMYARVGEQCTARMVDVRDRKTWITPEEVQTAFPSFAEREEARRAETQAEPAVSAQDDGAALRACNLIVQAYAEGEDGGSVSWELLDQAHEAALEARRVVNSRGGQGRSV